MQGVGALLISLAAWLFFCGAQSYRPLALLRAVLANPSGASSLLTELSAYVKAQNVTGSGPAGGASGAGNAPFFGTGGIFGSGTVTGGGVGNFLSDPLGKPFTETQSFNSANGGHKGVDLAIAPGTPVLAAQSGTVVQAGIDGTYGNFVLIDNGNGYQTGYAHMESLNVAPGQHVSQGQQIALSGGVAGAPTAGDSTGPHLHFELRKNGVKIDPAPYLANYGAFHTGVYRIG